jgi:DNA primase
MSAPHTRDALRALLSDPIAVCNALEIDRDARPQQNGLMISCLWHDDNNPSCSVTNAEDGGLRVHCFACGVGGDVFSLIGKVRGLDVKTEFPAVLAVAAEIAETLGAEGANVQRPRTAQTAHKSALPVEAVDTMGRTMLAAAPIANSREVTAYLFSRKLLQQATDHGWGALPCERKKVQSVVDAVITVVGAEVWACSGMCGNGGALKYPDNVLIIPWRDGEGRITTLQRRVLTTISTHRYVFPNGNPPTEPYGVERLVTSEPTTDIAFVEGAIDVLAYSTLCERSGKNRIVLGLPGASSWRPTWESYVAGRVVHLAFDADEAGDRAALVLSGRMYAAGATRVDRQRPRGANDWAELLEKRAA